MRRVIAAAIVVGVAVRALATMGGMAEPVPVSRLVANLTRLLEKDEKNAAAHYALGRVHSLAFATPTEKIGVWRPAAARGNDPKAAPGAWTELFPPLVDGPLLPARRVREVEQARLDHFQAAVLHLRRAAELAPAEAVHHLGVAWLLDSGSDLAPKLGWPDGVAQKSALADEEELAAAKHVLGLGDSATAATHRDALRALGPRGLPVLVPALAGKSATVRLAAGPLVTAAWKDMALEAYLAAYRAAKPDELEVLDEAHAAILRLLAERPPGDEIAKLRTEVEERWRRIERPNRGISPIVFPVRGDAPLADLVPEGRTAVFDLDGDDVAERWPWPSADAAILVWRPDPEVPVTSGRQLFGSRTWWIFWENGYEPLAALDDDGDGRLTGVELEGIGVWRDRNGDAVEDAGEVVTAAAYGIAAIETVPDATEDGVPARRRGVVLADGTTRPTYDWTPRAVPEASRP
jgi:hypothetical protein